MILSNFLSFPFRRPAQSTFHQSAFLLRCRWAKVRLQGSFGHTGCEKGLEEDATPSLD